MKGSLIIEDNKTVEGKSEEKKIWVNTQKRQGKGREGKGSEGEGINTSYLSRSRLPTKLDCSYQGDYSSYWPSVTSRPPSWLQCLGASFDAPVSNHLPSYLFFYSYFYCFLMQERKGNNGYKGNKGII